MKTNDLKKGNWVLLRNGWHGEVLDNKKGNTRIVDVYGDYHEAGSVYSHDIVAYANGPDSGFDKSDRCSFKWFSDIQHTPEQVKLRNLVGKEN
jgi:hypothetical protein